jgi:hypothetical protein
MNKRSVVAAVTNSIAHLLHSITGADEGYEQSHCRQPKHE